MIMDGSSDKIVAIVLARGGSKGIPRKNIMPFCGKPLLQWTLEQLKACPLLHSIWVSSDSEAILALAQSQGCCTIYRPAHLAADTSTSESGWVHALDIIEDKIGDVAGVLAAQVTSPLRLPNDFANAVTMFNEAGYDSIFAGSPARDLCLWQLKPTGLQSMSYDNNNPDRRRQTTFGIRWIENGSFYLFKPEVLLATGVRFGNRVGVYPQKFWQMFEIDESEDVPFCECVMQAYLKGDLK